MRPTRPCFQSQAARETLWDWDPCSIAISTTSSKTSIFTFSIKPQRRWKPQLQPQQEKPTHNVNVTQVFFKSFYASDKYNKIFVLEKLGNALWTLVQHWNLINQNDTFTTSNTENKTNSVCGVCVCVCACVSARVCERARVSLNCVNYLCNHSRWQIRYQLPLIKIGQQEYRQKTFNICENQLT